MLSADVLAKENGFPYTKPLLHETSFRSICALSCPSCSYCEFPGCDDHQVLLTVQRQNGHAYCHANKDGACSTSTAESSPWNLSCRECGEVRCDVTMWTMSDLSIFRFASAIRAMDKATGGVMGRNTAICLTCDSCGAVEAAFSHKDPLFLLTVEEHTFARSQGTVFSVDHLAPNCSGSIISSKIVVSASEVNRLTSILQTTPRLLIPTKLKLLSPPSPGPLSESWVTHPSVDGDQTLLSGSLRSATPSASFSLAKMDPPQPYPVWQTRAFVGLFCDPFVRDTELEGGSLADALAFQRHYLRQLARTSSSSNNDHLCNILSKADTVGVEKVADLLSTAYEISTALTCIADLPHHDPPGLVLLNGSPKRLSHCEMTERKKRAQHVASERLKARIAAAAAAAAATSGPHGCFGSDSEGSSTDDTDTDEASYVLSPSDLCTVDVAGLCRAAASLLTKTEKEEVKFGSCADESEADSDEYGRQLFHSRREAEISIPSIKEQALAAVVMQHIRRIEAMANGDVYSFPGGYFSASRGHALMVTLLKNEADFSLVVTNTGEGISYHPEQQTQFKPLTVTNMCLEGVAASRAVSPFIWTLFFRLQVFASNQHHILQLYDVIFPFLVGGPLKSSLVCNPEWLNSLYLTAQRAGTCFYRCVSHLTRYLLLLVCGKRVSNKMVSFGIRYLALHDTLSDLQSLTSLYDASDIPLIRIAARQTIRAFVRSKMVDQSGMMLSEGLRRTVLSIEQRLSSLPVPESLQWAPTYLTGIAAELSFTNKVALCASPGAGTSEMGHSEDGRSVISFDISSASLASGHDLKNQAECSISLPAIDSGDEEGAGAHPVRYTAPLLPSSLLRQSSCDMPTDPNLEEKSTSADCEGDGPTEEDIEEILLPPPSICSLPDKAQMLSYLPPALRAEPNVSGLWSFFGGFDSFAHNLQSESDQMAGPSVAADPHIEPDLSSLFPACDPRLTDETNGSSDIVLSLTVQRDAVLRTMEDVCKAVSSLLLLGTAAHYHHAHALLLSLVENYIPVPKTLRERGLDVFPPHRYSDSKQECTESVSRDERSPRRNICCIWQDSLFMPKDVSRAVSLFKRVQMQLLTTAASLNHDAPSEECRNIMSMAHILASIDALMRVRTTNSPWATALEGGLPLEASLSDVQLHAIFAVSTKDALGVPLEVLTSCMPIYSPANAVVRGKVLAYLKEREARANALIFTVKKVGVFSAVLKKDGPESRLLQAFSQCTGIPLERTTKPGGDHIHDPFKEALGWWLTSSVNSDASSRSQSLPPFSDNHPELYALRDATFALQFLLLPSSSRTSAVSQKLWPEKDAEPQWDYFVPDAIGNSNVGMLLRWFSKVRVTTLTFENPRSICSSPACADYYIFPNSLLDDGKTGEGMRELQSRASLPSYGTDVVFERYLAQADLGPAHVRSSAAAGGYFVQRRASNHFDEVPLSSVAAQLFGHVNRDAAMSSFSLNGRLAVKAEQMTAPRRGPADTFQTTPGVAEKKTRNDTLILAADVDSCLSADFSELAVQYGNEFPTFQRFLTPDESERLIVALSEPYNRIPLLLTQFVEGAKNNWLQNTALRQMLIAATFEPHRWQSSFLAAQPFTSIPAHPFVLGTPHGLLFNELLHSPGSVLAPVCALFDAVFEPLASQTSSVIDSLGLDESVDSVIASLAEDATRSALPSSHILAQALFTTRYLIRVESFARLVFHGLSNVSSASCSPFDEFSSPNSFSSCCSLEALAEGLKGIRSRLVRVALPLLLCWRSNILGQEQSAVSERDRNFLRSSGLNRLASLHAHIALILGPQPSSGTFEQSSLPCHPLFSITRLTPLQTALFLGCVGFVQMWAPSSSPCQQSVTSITPNQSGTCSTDPESESRYVIPLQELMGLMASSRSLAFKIFDELPVDVRSRLLSLVLCWIRGDAQSGAATSGLLWERSLVSKGCYTECLTGTSLSVFTALTTTNSMRITPAPAELMKHDSFVTVIGASDSPLVTTTSTREYQTGFTVFGTNTSAKLWSSFSRAQTFLMAPSALGKGDTLRVAVESGGIEFRGVQYTRKFGQTPLADAEEWVAKLFVPFLVESYGNTELLPFSWFLPSATIGDSSVAVLFGYDSFNLTWQFALLGRSRATVQLFFLQEQGRVLYPVLSFSSISSLSLSSFAPSLLFPFSKDHDMNTQLGRAYQKWKKRFFSETNRFAAGNRKPRVSNGSSVVLTMKAPAPPLGFERSLAWAPQGDVVHVPPFLLNGLVPSILLSIFTFELSLVDFTLRGLPLPDYATQPEWRFEIIIVLSDVPEGLQDVSPERALDLPFALGNKIAVIFRVPHRDDLVYEQRAEIASHTKVLISLSGSLPGSPLGRLTDVITRIENVSETLVWANVPAQVKMASWLFESEDGFTCPQRCAMMREFASSTLTIDTIELPRLNLFFKFQADSAGRTRLFSKHHPDMYVSDVRSYLIAPLFMGIPHGLLLQNKYGSLFMLVPNYPVSRPPVRVSPLSADITQDRFDSKWVAAAALSPYYLYPIHSSHLRLLLPEGSGLGPLFYLVTLRLLHRAYADAFQLAGQSFTDTKLTSEEIFMFKGIEASLDDKHPDAVAVRIRLQVLTAHCDIETHWVKPVADLFNSGEDYSIEEDIEELYAKRALASRACSFSASDAKSIDELISKKFPKGVVLMRTFNMQRILRAEHKINVYRENELRKGGCLDEHVSDAFGGLVHSSAYQRYFDFQYEKSSGGIITRRPRLFSETERFESIICDDYTSDTLSNMEDELCPLRTTMGTTLLCPKPDGVMDAWDTVVSVANARLSFCQLSINSPVGWKAMVTYDRPPRRKLRGAYLISTVIRALEDHISGSRNKLGLLLVFDLLQGGRPTTFCETSDQRKARKDRAGSRLAHRKQPPSGCLQGTSDYAVDSNGRGLESDILPGTDTAVPRIITESLRRTICKARYGIPLDARETRSIDAWCVQKAKLSKSDVVSRETIDLCSLLCSWHAVVMTRIRPDSAENMSLSVFSILGLALEQKKKAAGYSLNSANATLRSIQHPWAQKAVEPSADAILSAHIDWRLMRSQLLRSVRTDSPNTALHSFIAHCGGAALKLIESVPQANVRNDEAGHYNVETTIFDYDPAPAAIDRSLQNRFISVEMLPSHLRMSPHELEALITQPLFSANIPIVLKAQNSRSDCSVSCEPQSLPFNLDSHPAFSGKHAADMLARIKHDYSSFRSTSQSEHIPIIPQIESFLSSLRQESATHSDLDATLKHLSILTMSLKTLLERDIMFASKARVFAEWSANSIPMANVSLPEDLEESVTLKNTFDQVPSLLRSVSVSATGVSAQSLVQISSLPMRESKQIAVRPPVGKNKTLKTTNTMFLRERCLHDILLLVQSDPWRSSSIADLAKEWSNELSVTTFPITASHYGKLIMRSLDSVRSFITNLPADHFLREDLGETCPSPAASSCSLEAITLAFERPPALQNASGEIKRILKTIPLTEKGREMEIDKCPRTSADFLSLSMLANANGAPTDENKTEKVSKEKVNEMEIKESVEGFFATAAFIERGKMRLKEVLHRGEHAAALPLCKALRRAKEKQRKTALRLRLLLAASFLRVEQSKKLNRNRILRACSASTQLVSRLLVYELIRVGAHDTMRLARQNMLEQYAEQKNVFRMNDLVHAIASTTSDGSNTLLHCLARHVSDNEGTQRVMTVTALFMLLTNRISLARKALHATRTFAQNIVRCCLRRSSPIFLQPNASSSDILSLQQQSNSLIQLLKTGLYYVTIVRTAQDGDETVGSDCLYARALQATDTVIVDPRMLAFEFAMGITLRKEQVSQVRSFLTLKERPFPRDVQNPMIDSLSPLGHSTLSLEQCGRHDALKPSDAAPNGYKIPLACVTELPRLSRAPQSSSDVQHGSTASPSRLHSHHLSLALNLHELRKAELQACAPAKTYRVQQMLMGAGKTTVVAPLILSISSSLPKQSVLSRASPVEKPFSVCVVPQALLQMTINVLRSRLTGNYAIPICSFHMQRDFGGFLGLGSSMISQQGRLAQRAEAWMDAHSVGFTYDSRRIIEAMEQDEFDLLGAQSQPPDFISPSQDISALPITHAPPLEPLLAKMLFVQSLGGILVCSDTTLKTLLLKRLEIVAAVEDIIEKIVTFAFPQLTEAEIASRIESVRSGIAANLSSTFSKLMRRRFPFQVHKLLSYRVALNYLSRIVDCIRSGTLVMDEVDVLLHPLKSELNFPIGSSSHLQPAPSRWRIPLTLLDTIHAAAEDASSLVGQSDQCVFQGRSSLVKKLVATTEGWTIFNELRKTVSIGIDSMAILLDPHPILLDQVFYNEQLKPLLSLWARLILVSLDVPVTAINIASQSVEPQLANLHDVVLDYIRARDVSQTCEPGRSVSLLLKPEQLGLTNLIRDWVHNYLPHVLCKVNRVSFGLLPPLLLTQSAKNHPRSLTAVPYAGKDVPSSSAEFAHPDILAGLTVISYMAQGLRPSDVRLALTQLKKLASKELGPESQRPSAVLFECWMRSDLKRESCQLGASRRGEGKALGSLFTVQPGDASQLQLIHNRVRHVPGLIEFYLLHHVFPTAMKRQALHLSLSGGDVASAPFFGSVVGFSGTPSNLLPKSLGACSFERGSDGRIVSTLTNLATTSTKLLSCGWTAKVLLKDVATSSGEQAFMSLIDTGALVTGLTNEEVANFLLDCGLSHVGGVVFFDSADVPYVMLRQCDRNGKRVIIPFSLCGLPNDQRFTFYDQVHTVGIDISQAPDARAAITLGKDLTLRDFSQGAYRMRGISFGQKITIITPPELCSHVRSATSMPPDSALTPSSIVAWLLVNSALSEQVQFVQLCRMHAVERVRSTLIDIIGLGYWGKAAERPTMLNDGVWRNVPDLLSLFCERNNLNLVKKVPSTELLEDVIRKQKKLIPWRSLRSCHASFSKEDTSFESAALALAAAGGGMDRYGRLEQEMVTEQIVETEVQSDISRKTSTRCSVPESPPPWSIAHLFSIPSPIAKAQVDAFELLQGSSSHSQQGKCRLQNPFMSKQFLQASPEFQDHIKSMYAAFKTHIDGGNDPDQLLSLFSEDRKREVELLKKRLDYDAQKAVKDVNNWSMCQSARTRSALAETQRENVSLHGVQNSFAHPFFSLRKTAVAQDTDGHELPIPETVAFSRHLLPPTLKKPSKTDGIPFIPSVIVVAEWHVIIREAPSVKIAEEPRCRSSKDAISNVCDFVSRANGGVVPVAFIVTSLKAAGLHLEAEQIRLAVGNTESMSAHEMKNLLHQTMAVVSSETAKTSSELEASSIKCSSWLVALCLAEAASLRRAIHSGSLDAAAAAWAEETHSSTGQSVIGVSLKLHHLNNDGPPIAFWASWNSKADCSHQASVMQSATSSWLQSSVGKAARIMHLLFNSFFFFTKDDVSTLVRALSHVPLSSRRALFQLFLESRMRSHSSPEGTPVDRVFKMSNPARLLQVSSVANLLADIIVKSTDGLKGFFSSFGLTDKDHISPRHLREALIRSSAFSAPIASFADERCVAGPTLGLRCEERVIFSVVRQSLSLVSAPQRMFAATFGCLLRSALTEGEKTEESPGVSAYFDALDEAGSGWLIRPSARAKMADIQAHKLLCSDVIKLERLEVAVQSLMLEWDSDEDGLISYSELESWLRQLGKC